MTTITHNPNYLTGKLLLAMPGMGDPRFNHAVIFICSHDANGAMGLVINNVLPGIDLAQLLRQMNITAAPGLALNLPVLSGGPVENARGFVLHTSDFVQPDTIRVNGYFGITGTIDALRAIAAGKGPQRMLFALGYSGWGAGQLDRELQDNAWLIAEAGPDAVFDTVAEEKWNRMFKTLGIDPAMLSGAAGRA